MKKNNKGFTLIELLAIIVILAIIAVITIPIILNVIENSRKGAAIDSAYGYKDAVSKYYVSEMIENQDLKLDGAYSVDEGTLKKGSDTPIRIPTSGDTPSIGWIKIKENEVTKGCLTIGDYKVELKDKTATAEKGECDSEMPIVKFDEATLWSDIITAIQNDETEGMNIGDTKTVNLGETLGIHTLRIANLSSPKDEGCGTEGFSETACGFVLEFADIITTHGMNATTTSETGWGASDMREYVNSNIYDALPDEIKTAIIETTVVSGRIGSESNNYAITDWLYLLSTKEVWNGAEDSNVKFDVAIEQTRQLDYYKEKKVTLSDNVVVAIKNDSSENAKHWWLRTAYNNQFFRVDSLGKSGYIHAPIDYGVSPAFRIAEKVSR